MATNSHHLNLRGGCRALLLLLVVASAALAWDTDARAAVRPGAPCFSPVAGLRAMETHSTIARRAPAARGFAYDWPLKPFRRQHPIRGYFNDPREGKHESRQFHFGIDVAAPNGTAVYAVAAGTVYLQNAHAVAVRAGGRRSFEYWHIVPVVRHQQYVRRHQLLGHIEKPWAHVHFAESLDGEYVNPLRAGALGPYTDSTVPRVADVRFTRGGRPLAFGAVAGRVDLIVDAYDETPLQVSPRWWADMPVVPATLRWRILRGNRVIRSWRPGPALGGRFRKAGEFFDTYTPQTRQNHPHKPGRYCIYLQRGWDASALGPGRYTIEVEAADTAGNRGWARLAFTVARRS